MRIYTEVNFIWDNKQGKLVETSSEWTEQNLSALKGEIALCGEWVTIDLGWDDAGNYYQGRGWKVSSGWTEWQVIKKSSETAEGEVIVNSSYDYGNKTGMVNAMYAYIKGQTSLLSNTEHESGLYATEDAYAQAFENKYGFKPNADSSKNKAFLEGLTAEDFEETKTGERGEYIGDQPEWAGDTTQADPLEFDPGAVASIKEHLDKFKKIITKGEADPDIYEQEVIDAVRELGDIGLQDAQDALTAFSTDLGREWSVYEQDVIGIEEEWAVGDTWNDANKDGIVDEGELTDTDGDGVLTPPGTHVQEAFKEYGLKEDPLAIARDAALEDLNTRIGDPFVDQNDNKIWDPTEPWGTDWVDANGDYIIQADELTGSTVGGAPAEGTDVGKTHDDYLEGYRSIYGSAGSEDQAYTHEEAVTEGIITEQSDGTYQYADGTPAPSPDEWLEGSYYKETRLGYEAEELTREGALEALREEAKEKIRTADAKRGAAGFAATNVGGTARDILAKEIGKSSREVEKAYTEGRKMVRIGAEETKTTEISGEGGIEEVRDTALEGYYDENTLGRQKAASDYGTSEAILASNRDQALIDAAENMDPASGLIPQRQYTMESTARDLETTWKTEFDKFTLAMREYGSPAGTDPLDYLEPFEITGSRTQTEPVQSRAGRELETLAGSIESRISEQLEGVGDLPGLGYEDFDFWTDPRSPFKGLYPEIEAVMPWTPGEQYAGQFTGDISGLFPEFTYDVGTGPMEDMPFSWMHYDEPWGGQPMPWEEEDYTGTWSPYGQ